MIIIALITIIAGLFISIIITGIAAAAYYWRWKYEAISERMHNAYPLVYKGKYKEALEILKDH